MKKTQRQTGSSAPRKMTQQRKRMYELEPVTAQLHGWSSQGATVEVKPRKRDESATIRFIGRIYCHGEHKFSVSFQNTAGDGLALDFDLKAATILSCIDRHHRTVVLDQWTVVCLDEIAYRQAMEEERAEARANSEETVARS
jgi:hypothetical protein